MFDIDEPPLFGVDELRQLANLVRAGTISREDFFSQALWDPEDVFSGLDPEAGHLLYRLSDRIPPDRRRAMMIYPCNQGSILDQSTLRPGRPVRWDSLEDWRQWWEGRHPQGIPTFRKELDGQFLALTA